LPWGAMLDLGQSSPSMLRLSRPVPTVKTNVKKERKKITEFLKNVKVEFLTNKRVTSSARKRKDKIKN